MSEKRPVVQLEWVTSTETFGPLHIRHRYYREGTLCGDLPHERCRLSGLIPPIRRPKLRECDICRWRVVGLAKEFDILLRRKYPGETDTRIEDRDGRVSR